MLVFARQPTDLDPLMLDATAELVHQRKAVVTSVPVERGFSVVDHRRREPAVYRFRGVFTENDPSRAVAQQRTEPGPPAAEVGRADGLLARLKDLYDSDELLEIRTDSETVANAVIETFDYIRVGGDSIEVSGTFRGIVVSATSEVALPPLPKPSRESAKGKKDGGRGGKKETDEKTKARTILDLLAHD